MSVITSSMSFAQIIFSGSIKHIENNEPVIGAVIFIPEIRLSASTNENGNFKIPNVPKGKYLVEIKFIAHKTLAQKIKFESDTNIQFIMENATVSTDEVIVSGASIKTIVKESPIAIMTMGQAQWLGSGSQNLVDAVARMPGMSQVQTGPQLSKPIIRGLGFNRVITMHDGIRQEDNQWGEEHSIHVDEYSIDKYEIIKGAGSLMYGSDGLGGVMSVLSARPVEEGKIKGQFLTNYQTNSALLGGSVMLSGNQKGITWMARTSSKNSSNYQNRLDGRVYGSNFRENLNVNGLVGLQKKWGYSRVYFARWNQEINVIDGTRDKDGKFTKTHLDNQGIEITETVAENELNSRTINNTNSQNLTNQKLSTNNFFAIGRSSIVVNVGYSLNERKEYSVKYPIGGNPDLYFYLQTLFYDARFNLPDWKGWETTIGSNGMRQIMNNKGNEILYPDFNLFDNGVFVFTKKKFGRLIISGGIRNDIRIININKLYIDPNGSFTLNPVLGAQERFGGLNKTFTNITGSIGVVYRINEKLGIKANIARGFRAPSVAELSSNGEHAGTFRYEIGDVQMRSEESFQTDIGTQFEGKNVYLDFALFNNIINNFIYTEKLSGLSGDSTINGVTAYRYVQGNAQLYGLEGVITYNPSAAKWLSLTQNYSMVIGQNLTAKNEDARNLPLMPAPRWISRVQLNKDKLLPIIRNAHFFVEGEYNQIQNRPMLAYNTETETPAYFLLHSGIGTDITNNSGKTICSIYITGTNLLDEIYQSHQSRLKYLETNPQNGRRGVFNMGRNFSVRLLVPLDISTKKDKN
ncbi:MAG: TonB-dependent receptor [Bacteroidota bacterium]|nr:TonB-dependent receptor [Bacteroidota bacterium]